MREVSIITLVSVGEKPKRRKARTVQNLRSWCSKRNIQESLTPALVFQTLENAFQKPVKLLQPLHTMCQNMQIVHELQKIEKKMLQRETAN